MQTLTAKLPPTLNQMINAARTNRYSAAASKKKWTNYFATEAMKQLDFENLEKVRVIVIAEYSRTNSDPDNLMACLKYVFDGMTLAEILKNDTVKEIQTPILFCYRKKLNKDPQISLQIYDNDLEWYEDCTTILKQEINK